MQNQQQQQQPAAAAAAQAPGGPAAANNPSFTVETAVPYLTRLLASTGIPPSCQGLKCLAGNVASSMKPNGNNAAVRPEVAFLFLKACAYQLLSLNHNQQQQQYQQQAHAAGHPAAGGQHPAAAAAHVVAESSEISSKDVREIVEGIGNACIRCNPRSTISESGILPIMAMLCCPPPSASAGDLTSLPYLTPIHVEFLQACIYAEQYRYAQQCIANTWPRPTAGNVTVKHVLRYYYLRGCVHMNCMNFEWAIRCFNTCLVVPSEIVSSIAISAYKKLVLVQCLTMPAAGGGDNKKSSGTSDSSMITLTGPLQLPKAAPSCLSRFLSQAFHATTSGSGGGGVSGQQPMSAANPEEHDHYYSHEQQHEAMLVVNDGPPPQQGGGEGGEGGPSSAAGGGGAGGADGQNPNNNNNNSYQSLGVKPYADFVMAFTRLVDRTTLNELVEQHAALFSQDGNMGLIQQCTSDFVKRQVYHYSHVYSVLSLQDLSNFLLLPVPELRQLLMQLSMEKVWSIQIDDTNGLVRFPRLVDLPQQAGGGNGQPQVQQLLELTQLMQKLDLAVAASPKYVSVVKNTHNAKTAPPGAGAADAAAIAAAKEIGPRGVEDI